MMQILKNIRDWFIDVFKPDIVSEIKERTTNPFYISFAISWSIWNWPLLYIIFNFDANTNLTKRLAAINIYLGSHSQYWWHTLWGPLCTAFGVIVISSLLTQISLLIVVFARRKLRPLVYKYVGHRDDIVDTSTHLETKRQLQNLVMSYKDIQGINEKIISDNALFNSQFEKEKEKTSSLQIEKSILEIELQSFKSKHNLTELFPDKWFLYYITKEGFVGEEAVVIRGDKYMANDRLAFNLDMIEIDRGKEQIKFRKVGAEEGDRRKLVTELKIVNDKEYVGTENGTSYVRYNKSGYGHAIEFNPYYSPIRINVGNKTRISFQFKNNINRPIDILAYTFAAIYNGEKYRTFERHTYQKTLDSMQEIKPVDEFSQVDPLIEYFANKREPGIYDSEITVEYRERGSTEISKITRIARLIVVNRRLNSTIHIVSALYGAQESFNDETDFLYEYAKDNPLDFVVTNSFFEGRDPIVGTPKILEVKYWKDGVLKSVIQEEGKKFTIS